MEPILFLSRFWGGYLFISSFALFFASESTWSALLELRKRRELILLSGYLSLMLGLASVILYSEWRFGWELSVTLIGWSALLKGGFLLFFPDGAARWTLLIMKWRRSLQGALLLSAMCGAGMIGYSC